MNFFKHLPSAMSSSVIEGTRNTSHNSNCKLRYIKVALILALLFPSVLFAWPFSKKSESTPPQQQNVKSFNFRQFEGSEFFSYKRLDTGSDWYMLKLEGGIDPSFSFDVTLSFLEFNDFNPSLTLCIGLLGSRMYRARISFDNGSLYSFIPTIAGQFLYVEFYDKEVAKDFLLDMMSSNDMTFTMFTEDDPLSISCDGEFFKNKIKKFAQQVMRTDAIDYLYLNKSHDIEIHGTITKEN